MFCPNCGANLPEGTAFCGSCGAAQKTQQQAPMQQPAYQAPTQQPVYQAPAQPTYQPTYQPAPTAARAPMPVTKKDYLANHADEGTKKNAKMITITFILSMVLILASIIVPMAIPFFEIPVISGILSIDGADPDELVEDMEYSLDEIKDDLDYQADYMDDDELEAAEAMVDSMETLVDNFSVMNFKSLVSVVQKEGRDYMDSDDMDEIEQIGAIMDIVIGLLVGSFVLPLLFALLGGLNKSTGLTITALVFTVLSQLILCGILYVVLSLAIFIFQAVLCNKVQKAYNSYRLGYAR